MTGHEFKLSEENIIEEYITTKDNKHFVKRYSNQAIVDSLNEQEKTFKRFNDKITELHWENHQLTTRIETIKNTIEEAYQTERTELGRSVIKQLLEQIQ